MAKSRNKVQQLGFWDPEVASPDHDAVCMWVYDNPESILRAVHPELYDRDWSSDDIQVFGSIPQRKWQQHTNAFAANNLRPNPRIVKKELEQPLKQSSTYGNRAGRIVGYADLMLTVAAPEINVLSTHSDYAEHADKRKECEIEQGEYTRSVLVEAKSKLPSIGELMRQLQLYRTAFEGEMAVVAPDDSYTTILREQGIAFVMAEI